MLKRALRERALRKLWERASPKQNCCQTGPSTTANTEAGPNNRSGTYGASSLRRGPSKKKLLPKLVNDIQVAERVPIEAV